MKVAAICVLSADGGSGVSGVVQMVQNVGGKTSINIKVNRLQKKNKKSMHGKSSFCPPHGLSTHFGCS